MKKRNSVRLFSFRQLIMSFPSPHCITQSLKFPFTYCLISAGLHFFGQSHFLLKPISSVLACGGASQKLYCISKPRICLHTAFFMPSGHVQVKVVKKVSLEKSCMIHIENLHLSILQITLNFELHTGADYFYVFSLSWHCLLLRYKWSSPLEV